MASAGARGGPRRGGGSRAHGGVRVNEQRTGAVEPGEELSLFAALPGLARIAAAASIRLTAFTVEAYIRAGSRFLRGAASGAPPGEVIQQTADELIAYIREVLGVRENGGAPDPPGPPAPPAGPGGGGGVGGEAGRGAVRRA